MRRGVRNGGRASTDLCCVAVWRSSGDGGVIPIRSTVRAVVLVTVTAMGRCASWVVGLGLVLACDRTQGPPNEDGPSGVAAQTAARAAEADKGAGSGASAPAAKASPEAKPTDAAPADATPTDAAPTDTAPTDTTPTNTAATAAAPTDATPTDATPTDPPAIADPSGGGVPTPVAVDRPAPVLAAAVVKPSAMLVPWRQVAKRTELLRLEPLIAGVLGHSKAGYHDIDDNGDLVLRRAIEAPASPIVGYWPKNAWNIETRIKTIKGDRSGEEIRQIRLMRLRGNRRWVPQEYNYEQRFDDDGERFAIGGKGGLLVESDGSLTRVAGQAPDPEVGAHQPGALVGFFETRSGRLYTAYRHDDTVYVHKDCADQACVAANNNALPHGAYWAFSGSVPRQRHSVSTVAEVRVDEQPVVHVLHYETGGWKLEAMPEAVGAMWPTRDGGLWARVGQAVWHRDPDGLWHEIELPEGATEVTVAMRRDQSELWISATGTDGPFVAATHANAQDPAPESESTTP